MNQPRFPLCIIAGVNANSNAANIPAVVPPSTLTRAKITITVRAPSTAGNTIVKSSNELPAPKIEYKYALVICKATWDVLGISRPSGYHDIVSCHCQYASRPLSMINLVAR